MSTITLGLILTRSLIGMPSKRKEFWEGGKHYIALQNRYLERHNYGIGKQLKYFNWDDSRKKRILGGRKVLYVLQNR